MERDYIKQWKEITAQDGRYAGAPCLHCPCERGDRTAVPQNALQTCCGTMWHCPPGMGITSQSQMYVCS